MISFLINRAVQLIPVLWGVATLVFLLIHFIPGDPIEFMLGENALPANKAKLRSQLNLDKPLVTQYIDFWKNLARGDLGNSLFSRKSVSELIFERIGPTLELTIIAIFCALVIAIPIGLIAAIYKNSIIDFIAMLFSLIGVSMPNFWLGPLLIMFFAVKLNLLPVSQRSGLLSYILPALTLGLSMAAILARLTRTTLIDVLSQDYIRTAHAKGLKKTIVYVKHALKNALIPIITIVGLQLGTLLAGSIITETIFDWPGLGELLYRGIQSRDYPLVQGCVLIIAFFYVFANTLADIAYTLVNPKIKLE